MKRQSTKVRNAEPDFKAVYRLVDKRSEGFCEVRLGGLRCQRRATDHHHLIKPRRSHHDENNIVHLCRYHHDRCAWPFKRGRLIVAAFGGGGCFGFAVQFASDKFALR